MVKKMNISALLYIGLTFQSFISADPRSDKVLRLKTLLEGNLGHFQAIPIVDKDCDVLLDNDAEILEILVQKKLNFVLEHLLMVNCSDHEELFKKAAEISAQQVDYFDALTRLTRNIDFYDLKSRIYHKYIFEAAIKYKRMDFLSLYGDQLCKMTDKMGRNALHLAAIYNIPEIFGITEHCKLLINHKDLSGKYPIEYVTSVESASAFNQRWLEVAKDHYLALETASQRLKLCNDFGLEDSISNGEVTVKGIFFKEAYKAGIYNVEDIYCPYLKMKLNLIKGDGRDPSGLILEWLSYLLSDIFGSSDDRSKDTDSFQAPFFRINEQGDYVPSGLYSEDVYEFLGKVLSIANYFGLGLSYKIVDDSSASYYSIQRGKSALQFIRIEVHTIKGEEEQVLRSRGQFIILRFEVKNSRYKAIEGQSLQLLKAFKSLSDEQKMEIIGLVSDDLETKWAEKGPITFSVVNSRNPVEAAAKIVKTKKTIEFKAFAKTSEYKEALLNLIK